MYGRTKILSIKSSENLEQGKKSRENNINKEIKVDQTESELVVLNEIKINMK